jgi:hypothetical protein
MDDMDTEPPSFSLWNVPAEIRRAEGCTKEEPCLSAARDDDDHHHNEHVVEAPVPPPPSDEMPPGQRLLDIPHMWRRQQEAAWLHAVRVNQMILYSGL